MIRRFALGLALTLAAAQASAHPHVFVDAEAGFGFDAQGRLASVEVVWRYDAFASLFLLEEMGLDPDGDGALTGEERAALAADQTEWPETFEGDSYLRIGTTQAALTPARDGTADVEDGRIVVRFRRDLVEPVPAQGLKARLEIYDPSYFFAYAIVGTPALRDAPAGCAAAADPFEIDDAASALLSSLALLGREETPDDPNVGASFADAAVLTCD